MALSVVLLLLVGTLTVVAILIAIQKDQVICFQRNSRIVKPGENFCLMLVCVAINYFKSMMNIMQVNLQNISDNL